MVRLDVSRLRYLNKDDFRVLTAVEMGMKNHEVVPTQLILRIANLKKTNGHLIIATLAKYGLIRHENKFFDGYKLTYQGYDFLAIKSLVKKGLIKGVGQRIGVGKESDIYEVLGQNDEVMILKVHRLGRICFRSVKQKRDYLGKRKNASFMYMSRLAAVREFAYLKALYDEGFPTPIPYEINRHCILMSRVNGKPLSAFTRLKSPMKVYNILMNLLVKFAQCGLIHGDFNEFNLLISPNEEITVIDFPQMISVTHPNAKELFDRDAGNIRRFFVRKMGYEFHEVPQFITDTVKTKDLDIALKASGSSKLYIAAFGDNDREKERVSRMMEDARELLLTSTQRDHDDEDYDEDGEYDEDDEGVEDGEAPQLISCLRLDDDNDDDDVTTKKPKVKKGVSFGQDVEKTFNGDDEEEDDDDEMIIYDDEDEEYEDEDEEDEEEEEHGDDRMFMRSRRAKNADKYNSHSKFFNDDVDIYNDNNIKSDDDDDELSFANFQRSFDGLMVQSDSDDDETSGALYTGSYTFDDDFEDEDDDEDYEDEDDEDDGDAKKGFKVGKLWFATRAEKKEYLQRQKDLAHRSAVRAKRENGNGPSRDQVRMKVKRASDKEKEKTRNKVKKINKGADKRTKNRMKEIKAAISAHSGR